MTPKQERFVEEYLIDMNATQAAIRAGYSAKTAEQAGYRALRDVHIAAGIAKARAKLAKRTEITLDSLTQMFLDDRKLAIELKQPAAATAAAMNIGKLHGYYVERQKVEGTVYVARMPAPVEGLTDWQERYLPPGRTSGKPAPTKQ